MKALARARSIGGSVVVTIPREIVVEERILPGELLEVQVRKIQKSFFGLAKGIGPFTLEDEMTTHG